MCVRDSWFSDKHSEWYGLVQNLDIEDAIADISIK